MDDFMRLFKKKFKRKIEIFLHLKFWKFKNQVARKSMYYVIKSILHPRIAWEARNGYFCTPRFLLIHCMH